MRFAKRTDIIGVLLIVVLLVVVLNIVRQNFGGSNSTAYIYHNNTLVKTVPLNSQNPQTVTIVGAEAVTIQYDGMGSIYFKDSDCPDRICINAGKLKQYPDTAACLPNGVIIKIMSDKLSEIDGTT